MPSGTDLIGERKELLLDHIANRSEMSDDEPNAATRAEIEAALDATSIARCTSRGGCEHEQWDDMNSGEGIDLLNPGPNVYVAFQT